MNVAVAAPADAGWSAARVALLDDHFNIGLTAAESAGLIGGVSKNAVISKRRRLGLVATVAVGCSRDWMSDAVERRRARRPARGPSIFRGPPPLPVHPLPDMEGPLPADSDPKVLTARRFGECAWPLGPAEAEGDNRTLFCCAPTQGVVPYCAVHSGRAYRPRS
jgi:GcrA cell cycle regulator